MFLCGIFQAGNVFGACGDGCKIQGRSGTPDDKGGILKNKITPYPYQTKIDTAASKQDKCKNTSYDHAGKCSWWCGCKEGRDEPDAWDVIIKCDNNYLGVRPTDTELNNFNTKYSLALKVEDYYQKCVKKGEVVPDSEGDCPGGDEFNGATKCKKYYVAKYGEPDTAEERAFISECNNSEFYESVEYPTNELTSFGITLGGGQKLYKKCALKKCKESGKWYELGQIIETSAQNTDGSVGDYICMRKTGENAERKYFIKNCQSGHIKGGRWSPDELNNEKYITTDGLSGTKFEGYVIECKQSREQCTSGTWGALPVNSFKDGMLLPSQCDTNAKWTEPRSSNLVLKWRLYCAELDNGGVELQCRPYSCIDGYYVNSDGKCEAKSNAISTSDSNDSNKPENKKTPVEEAKLKIKQFTKSVDMSKKSAWKTAEGKFNTARLTSDLTAGVVLGTVGGVVSGVVIKKKQVEKGFEALHCTVAGQSLADWGDTFKIGYTRK